MLLFHQKVFGNRRNQRQRRSSPGALAGRSPPGHPMLWQRRDQSRDRPSACFGRGGAGRHYRRRLLRRLPGERASGLECCVCEPPINPPLLPPTPLPPPHPHSRARLSRKPGKPPRSVGRARTSRCLTRSPTLTSSARPLPNLPSQRSSMPSARIMGGRRFRS